MSKDNQFLNFIYERIAEMIRELPTHEGNIRVYLHPVEFREFEKQSHHTIVKDFNRSSPAEIGMGTELEKEDPFITTTILKSGEILFFEEPQMREKQIMIVDQDSLYLQSGVRDPRPHILNPEGIRKFFFEQTPSPTLCSNCNEQVEIFVEGDEGEPFCSMNCLYEAYSW